MLLLFPGYRKDIVVSHDINCLRLTANELHFPANRQIGSLDCPYPKRDTYASCSSWEPLMVASAETH